MRYEKYKDRQEKWRWRLVAKNGKKLSVSSESYHNESECDECIQMTKNSANALVLTVQGTGK